MVAFYVFGIIDLQDMFPLIMEALNKNKKCWICFFDCTAVKRQFYHYKREELEQLFSKYDNVIVDLFRPEDKSKYEWKFNFIKSEIDTIFIQNLSPKKPIWYPTTGGKNIVHLAFWDESKHLAESRVPRENILFSVLKREEDRPYYKGFNNIRYFGDLRLENLKYVPENQRTENSCFIPETYLRTSSMSKEKLEEETNFYNKLFDNLLDSGYKINWKKREKGFPKQKWASPLDFADASKIDNIVDKDLHLPSSIFSLAYNSNLCVVVNDSFVYYDLIKLNSNCIILSTTNVRKYKMDEFFNDYKVLDMTKEVGWETFQGFLETKNKKEVQIPSVAKDILKECL